MPATLQFVVYLLALLCLLVAALRPILARQAPHFGWLGLALVTLVPLVAAAQAAL
jgi:hypothetical protein